RFLTIEEVNAMFDVSKDNPRDNLLLRSYFYLGLRNAELKNLKIEDVDLINRVVKVVQGKGKKDRYVPIPTQDLIGRLRDWIAGREEGQLFEGLSNGRLSDRHIRRIVKDYARKAGIRKASEVHPHTLRHSYATFLQNRGVPLNMIQNILGHDRIETTTVYLHLGIERMREHVEKAFRV
ncbi:MAG: tyrosine-type recombinase/integrase, partial [Candidatus Aenigmatarchaeota archaeon]